ncbi:MAG: hypothetical protein QNJ98_18980 [Planctomycetota bacterium]|nr:hypothetical protein [Planctomycetota bacterium]
MAVGRDSGVLIFRNVLYKQFGDIADVHLLEYDNNNDGTVGVFVADNRIFVSLKHEDRVYIWNDFANVTSGQAPDVELTNGLDGPNRLVVYNGDLYVSCEYSDRVAIFRDVTTLSNSSSPDVRLDDGIDEPKDLVVANDSLYVASEYDNRVCIWRNVAALGDWDSADAKLRTATSLIVRPQRLALYADSLYVSSRDHSVTVFRNASLLMDDAPPDVVLGGPSNLDRPRRVLIDAGGLYIPNKYGDYEDDEPGLSIFRNPMALTFGQTPDVAVTTEVVSRISASDLEDNVFAGFSREVDSFFFFLQAHRIEENSAPDVMLWDPRIRYDNIGELILVPR